MHCFKTAFKRKVFKLSIKNTGGFALTKNKTELDAVLNLIIVFIFLLFPIIIDSITNSKIQFNVVSIFILGTITSIIYKDFKNKTYTTIALVRIIDIILLSLSIFIILDYYNIIDSNSLLYVKKITSNSLLLYVIIFCRPFLKSDRFLIEKN